MAYRGAIRAAGMAAVLVVGGQGAARAAPPEAVQAAPSPAAPAPAANATAPSEPITQRHDNFESAVTSPAEDLNLRRTAIPEVLQRAVANAYDMSGVDRCPGLRDEIARIDAAIGPDKDAPPPPDTRSLSDKRGSTAAGLVRTGVEWVTPYRGIIRRITGATSYEKKVQAAVEAGFARRGFLKGMGMKMNCAPPAAPAWFKPAPPAPSRPVRVRQPVRPARAPR